VDENALEADLQGVCMAGQENRPRALFYSGAGQPLLPDHQVCSGKIPSTLGGSPCPYSIAGRIPDPVVIGEKRAQDAPEIGQEGEQAPPCAVRHYGSLADWVGPKASGFSRAVLRLRLFECRQRFLLVVPGIQNDGGVTDESVGDV
jgi:hypothetical protein